MINNKTLLIKGKAGLGNRILAVLEGILYAQITHRKVVVDWSDYAYSNNQENVFHKFFTAPDIGDLSMISPVSCIYPKVWENNLNKSVNEIIDCYDGHVKDRHRNPKIWQKYTIDITHIDYHQDILVRWTYVHQIYRLRRHLKGEFQHFLHLNDSEILSKIFFSNLRINDTIKQRAENFKNKYFIKKQIIGVHVRYTDLKNPYDKYYKFINEISQNKTNVLIFLSTDNQEVEKQFKTKYKNVVTTCKWYPVDQSSLHQNLECPDRFENGVEALIDIYLLSQCHYLIHDSTSTFAYLARLLSNIPEENVIDISKYSLRQIIKKNFSLLRQRAY